MSTYRFQETLEKLPIPDLVQTCNAYLEALKPLQTEQEHEKYQNCRGQISQW